MPDRHSHQPAIGNSPHGSPPKFDSKGKSSSPPRPKGRIPRQPSPPPLPPRSRSPPHPPASIRSRASLINLRNTMSHLDIRYALENLRRLRSRHEADLAKYSLSFAFIGGYLVILMIALSIIGFLINDMLSKFEKEIHNRGMGGGYASLYDLNESMYVRVYQELVQLTVEPKVVIPSNESIKSLLNETANYMDDLSKKLTTIENNFEKLKTKTQDSFGKAKSKMKEHKTDATNIQNELQKIKESTQDFINKSTNDDKLKETLEDFFMPIGSIYLQCHKHYRPGMKRFSNQWKPILGNNRKFIKLKVNVTKGKQNVKPVNTIDSFNQLVFHLLEGTGSVSLNPAGLTHDPNSGFLAKFSFRTLGKLDFHPKTRSCVLWKRSLD